MGVLNLQSEKDIRKSVNNVNSDLRFVIHLEELESGNLFNKKTEKQDTYVNGTNGTEGTLSSYAASDFIPVSRRIYPTLKVKSRNGISEASTVVYNNNACFYDQNHKYLSQAIMINNSCEIPEDACYFRFTYSARADRNHDALVYYGNKELGWLDLPYRPVNQLKSSSKNLISENDIIVGLYNQYTSNTYSISLQAIGDYSCTGFIKVKPNTKYVVSSYYTTADFYSMIYCFDKNKNFIGKINLTYIVGGVFTTLAGCCYVSLNYYTENIDYRDKPFFLYEQKEFEKTIGSIIKNNADLTARNTSQLKEDNLYYTTRIIGLYENHAVKQKITGGSMWYSSNGLDGDFTEVELNTTNFPGLANDSTVDYVLFFTTNAGIRSLVFFNKNQLYCSTTGTFSGFEVPDIWDLKGNKSWRVADDDKDPTNERYRKYYPSDVATRQNAYMWHNGPVWIDGIGGQFTRGVMFCNYTSAYNVAQSLPSCLFYTEDGKNIYVQYEFGVYQKKYKLAGDATEKTAVGSNYGDEVTLSTMSGELISVTVKKRWNILPTAETPNPESIFEYSESVVVSSVSGNQFVLADASSINVNDVVILQGTATGDFAKMLNNDASVTNGGNVVFVVKAKNENNITLADAIGNPKNNLMCRHIHGVAEFGQGICIYTGEEYPESWFIYLAPYINDINNGVNMNNARWATSVVRLNSSKNAFQRSLGVYLRPDGKMIYVADSNDPFIKKAEALGKDIKMGAHGVFVTDISSIDNPTDNISKIDAVNDIYCLYKLGNILFVSDYRGYTYYSKDEGDTWNYICKDGTEKHILVGFDKFKTRFVFNTTRANQFVIELK